MKREFLLSALVIAMAAPALISDSQSIFTADENVKEITTPLQLRKLLDATSGAASYLILLYSAWCPHCHAFAPIWSQLGARRKCEGTRSDISLFAFECMGQQPSRTSPVQDWKRHTGCNFPGKAEDDVISPNEICALLADGSYPSILLSVSTDRNVETPFERFTPKAGILPSDVGVYHLPVDSHITTSASLTRTLRETGLINEECGNDAGRDAKALGDALAWLEDAGDEFGNWKRQRWRELPSQTDPDTRLHDGIIGVYHILGDWVFAERPQLEPSQRYALQNFLLALVTWIPDIDSKAQLYNLLLWVRERSEALEATEWRRRIWNLRLMGVDNSIRASSARSASKTCGTNSCLVWLTFHSMAQLRLAALEESARERLGGKPPTFLKLFTQHQEPQLPQAMPIEDLRRLHVRASDVTAVLDQLITNFFNCKTCKEHFHDAYRSCAADRCAWTGGRGGAILDLLAMPSMEEGYDLPGSHGLVLWLWRFHNIVTVRTAAVESLSNLLMDFEEDKHNHTLLYGSQDVRFPGTDVCSLCHPQDKETWTLSASYLHKFLASNLNETAMNFDQFDDWDVPLTAAYLRHYYTKPEWLPSLRSLTWSDAKSAFDSKSQDRRLRGLRPQNRASLKWTPLPNLIFSGVES